MKNIKDYLHLYLGCVITTHPNFRPNGKASIGKNGYAKLTADLLADIENKTFPFTPMLLLRPLSSMDNKRFRQLTSYEYWDDVPNDINGWFGARSKMIKELLDEHFDLFNLIEEGLAIDSTKLNSEPAAQESDTTNDK